MPFRKLLLLVTLLGTIGWCWPVAAQNRARLPRTLPAPVSADQLDDAWQSVFSATDSACTLRPGDEIWLISTRAVAGSGDCIDFDELQVAQFSGCQWSESSFAELVMNCQSDASRQTMIYVHGNFTDLGWSLRRGCQVYDNLFGMSSTSTCPCDGEIPPMRFIIWSWSSEREVLPPRDFQVKVDRSWCEGIRLNHTLTQLSLERPIVMGYSLGVQAILAALIQEPAAAERSAWRVALIAPVVHDGFPHHFHIDVAAPSPWQLRMEQTVLFTNHRDRALKTSNRYFRIKNHQPAFNQYDLATALACQNIPLRHCELSGETNAKHAIVQYTQLPTVVNEIQRLVNSPAPTVND